MLQEDSNGESSFEIIDKKNQLVTSTEKTESLSTLSSVSSAYSIPSPSLSTQPSGNLLSNVGPPSSIPDFTLYTTVGATPNVTNIKEPTPNINRIPSPTDQFPATKFSAAIPPSKAIPHGPIEHPKVPQGENASTGLMGLFKEAFSTGGMLSKVAEKAKSSVDSIITTLDPQMSEYIYSGGDTEVTVASDTDEEVAALREAFHSVFGKAWVNGIKLNLPAKKSIPVGFEVAVKDAEEKITYSLKYRNTPTVAIEDVLLRHGDKWFGSTLLFLRDSERHIDVHVFSQAVPVPVAEVLKETALAKPDLSGLGTEDKLAAYLKGKPDWQFSISGVTKKEALFVAGKALVKIYKNQVIATKSI